MGCKYNFGEEKGLSYSLLFDIILERFSDDLDSVSDILFSESEKRRQDILLKLDDIRITYSPKKINSALIKESALTEFDVEYGNNDIMTIQEFLSSDLTLINGNRLYISPDLEEFKKIKITDYKRRGLTDKEAEEAVQHDLDRADFAEVDARLLHKMVVNGTFDGTKEDLFIEKAKAESVTDSKFDQRKRINPEVWRKFYYSLCNDFWKDTILNNFRGDGLTNYIKKGFNIKSEVKFDNKLKNLLTGHIDYLVIDDKGKIHLYNFFVTSKDDIDFQKKEYYEYKLLTLKKMLENNGIDTTNISLSYIPIKIKYKDNSNEVEAIYLNKVKLINYDYKRNPEALKKEYLLSKFIKSNTTFNLTIDDKVSEKMRSIITTLFPSNLNIDERGIHKTIDKWIADAPQEGESENPLVIKQVEEEGNWYEVYIDGELIAHIKSSKRKERNEEIKEVVTKHIEKLRDNSQKISADLYDAIKRAYNNNERFLKVRDRAERTLESSLYQYLTDIDPETKEHNWELIDLLVDYNILLFKKGSTVDVVYLSNESLDRDIDFENGLHNLLGKLKLDTTSRLLRGTYGTASMFISLLTLNEFLPRLNLNNFLLGKIRVLSEFGTQFALTMNIELLINKYFNEILVEINKATPELLLKNNFVRAKFADPISDIIEQLELITGNIGPEATLLTPEIENLTGISYDKKALLLRKLLDLITTTYFDKVSHEEIMDYYKDIYSPKHKLAVLYQMVSDAWLMYSGQTLIYDKKLEDYQMKFSQPAYISSGNVRLVVNNYRSMLDVMSDQINDLYDNMFYKPIMTYYEEIGYTALQNSTVGNLQSVYKNMFERDESGKLTMYFKNPYIKENDDTYLTSPERKFLKSALYLFNKFINSEFEFSGPEDPNFVRILTDTNNANNKRFLRVPLERASSSTNFFKNPKDKLARLMMYILNKKNLLDELSFKIDNFTREVKYNLSEEANVFNNMHIHNKFDIDVNLRRKYIEERGTEYFETNIEDLLIDVLGEAVEIEKTNKFLIATKAILFQLQIMLLDYSRDNDTINREMKLISDYLKVNVFKEPLVSGAMKKVTGVLMPVRSLVVKLNLAGNLIGFCRDIENGFVENFARTLTHYQTDINKSDVAKAYKAFFGEVIFTNPMKVNLLNKLCTIYRISNTDLARITERIKTDRAGFTNLENWEYFTLRAPDFLHRMTLFIAKCIHDGVIDADNENESAFSIKDNKLVYDWKKDKRFKNLAAGNKVNPEYLKELGLYIARIRMFNEEHSDKDPIPYFKENGELNDLPLPYTEGEIQSIKAVANNIYGDYDRSNKAMYEFRFIGLMFGMWTTWMNGIITNTISNPGEYNGNQKEWIQVEDAEGLLFIDPNDFTKLVHESDLKEGDLRIPMYIQQNSISAGLLPTLIAMRKYGKSGGSIREYIKSNPNISGLLNKAVLDVIITALIAAIYRLAIDPAYQDHKKQDDGREFLTNVLTQLIYKSTRASFDTFRGPINLVAYLTNNLNPPVWQTPASLIHDLGEFVMGDKTMLQVMAGNTGFGRTFQDAITMYKRDVQL